MAERRHSRGFVAVVAALMVAFLVVTLGSPAGDEAIERGAVGEERLAGLVTANTVKVLGFGASSLEGGSGVACPDGTTLTNRHVVEGSSVVNVSPPDGPTSVAGSRLGIGADVARVASRLARRQAALHLALADDDPAAGAPVTVAGYPTDADGLMVGPARVVDYVSGLTRREEGTVMRVSLLPRPGMSGGPVLDATGRLAGLLYAAEGGTGYGLVIPASRLRAVTGGC